MSAFNGTPGPWQTSNFDPMRVCDADGEVRGCSTVAVTEGTNRERKANATLIAQAPAMLQALVDSEPFVEYMSFNGNEQAHEAHKRIYAILAALREGGAL